MIDPRRIATLGIGFGALAVATLGFLPIEHQEEQPQTQQVQVVGGGAGGYDVGTPLYVSSGTSVVFPYEKTQAPVERVELKKSKVELLEKASERTATSLVSSDIAVLDLTTKQIRTHSFVEQQHGQDSLVLGYSNFTQVSADVATCWLADVIETTSVGIPKLAYFSLDELLVILDET